MIVSLLQIVLFVAMLVIAATTISFYVSLTEAIVSFMFLMALYVGTWKLYVVIKVEQFYCLEARR